MTHNMTHKAISVYPGEYTPLPETEVLLEELKISGKDSLTTTFINMDEEPDGFRIEVIVPGVKREELFVYVHDRVLSIAVLHKQYAQLPRKLQIHEFDSGCCGERHLLLPENADTEFVSAEYKRGILHIHLPKARGPFREYSRQIIVY